MVIPLRTLEQTEFEKAGNLFQKAGARLPNIFKVRLVSLNDAKTVHGNVMAHSYPFNNSKAVKPIFSG